jgi:hypothetical protein
MISTSETIMLSGRLLFRGYDLPWNLETDTGIVDLWPVIERFLKSIHRKKASHKDSGESYTLSVNPRSSFSFDYTSRENFLLREKDNTGVSNAQLYLEYTLTRLASRLVKIEIKDDKEMRITVDLSEKVFGVYFAPSGNDSVIPKDAEKTICKIGTRDCCIFFSAGADGFRCQKFCPSMARMLLERAATGQMRASRIGNCQSLGRPKAVN